MARVSKGSDWDGLKKYTDSRAKKMPWRTVGKMETILAEAFAQTQAATHVITGSLKASGTTESDFDGKDHWTGTISYGGPSTGPNNPVDYAIYEMNRGGSHDFFSQMPAFEKKIQAALDTFFEGK
jgi:hypothetical protein